MKNYEKRADPIPGVAINKVLSYKMARRLDLNLVDATRSQDLAPSCIAACPDICPHLETLIMQALMNIDPLPYVSPKPSE